MKINFVSQPFKGHDSLLSFVQATTGNASYHRLEMIVAWAKRSGLGRVSSQLAAFQARGGEVHAIVGVSEGGATLQGLKLLTTMTDSAFVFHDSARTFHPKVYLAYGDSSASVFVGSNNMTAGGVGWNYEAAFWLDLDFSDPDDRSIFDSVKDFIGLLRGDGDVCIALDAKAIAGLQADTSLLIRDEDGARRLATASGTPEDSDNAANVVVDLFGRSNTKKERLAPSSIQGVIIPIQGATVMKNGVPIQTGSPSVPKPVSISKGGIPRVNVQRRWYKHMDATAAQHPPNPNSSKTANLRLNRGEFTIDHRTYFRHDFFQLLPWSTSVKNSQVVEEVVVAFDVWVLGAHLGALNLRVSHAMHRIAGQGNVPTVLHWDALNPVLLATNYTGNFVTLEALGTGNFRLIIDTAPSGPFKY